MSEPQRIEADPAVALVAFRWPSSKVPGVFYDVALLSGEPQGWCAVCEGADPWNGDLPSGGCVCVRRPPSWSCSCPGFTFRDSCQHVTAARAELANASRRDAVQAERDRRLGCRHPLTVEDEEPDYAEQRTRVNRTCLGCGMTYERGAFLDRLEADIRERRRLPSSPWSAAERASDTE